eukprot:385878_1
MHDDDDDDEGDVGNESFDGSAWIYGCMNDNMTQKIVCKTSKCINLVPLAFNENNEDGGKSGNNKNKNHVPLSKAVRGAKGLEEDPFSCGILEIPPEAQKHSEISFFTEQFYVVECEKK